MINPESLFDIGYGLYIVCSGNADRSNGFIANSVFQVTASPVKFAVCCSKDNYTCELITNTKVYTLSVLAEDADIKLIGRFGYRTGRDFSKLEGIDYLKGKTGAPVVTQDSVSYLECRVFQNMDAGSHMIFIGEVVNAVKLNSGTPLTYKYYREVRKGKAPKNAPTYVDPESLRQYTDAVSFSKHKCKVCGYLYDPVKGDKGTGIHPGTAFEDLPATWRCPVCGAAQDDFTLVVN